MERRLEYMPLASIKPAKKNPKAHAEKDIAASVSRFGFVEPMVLDERTGRLVAGHGRLEQLKRLQESGGPPPDGLAGQPGGFLAPVLRGWSSQNDKEADAYLLASNRLTEIGGWDNDALASMLQGIAETGPLDGLGWTAGEVERMLKLGSAGSDMVPEPSLTTDVKLGDIYALGEHRLMCGDSTKPAHVLQLLDPDSPNGKDPVLMVTDPPYGVDYDPSWRDGMGVSAVRATGKVANDGRVDWAEAFALFPGDVAYVWHAGIYAGEVAGSLKTSGFEVRAQIIWAKPTGIFGRGAYHWQHEPCWYAVRKGSNSNWKGDRKQTTLWEVATVGGFGSSEDPSDASGTESKQRHGTQKPVELYRKPIINHTEKGDRVYEPFSGSGTALIACQELGRKCFAMELEPIYVQQAIDRWEAFTGLKPVRLKA